MGFLDFLAVFFAACVSAWGIGGGSIFILYITLIKHIEQLPAQGMNLIFFIPGALIATFCYFKKGLLDFKKLLPLIVGGLFGVGLGAILLKFIKPNFLRFFFAIFLLVVGTKTLFEKKKT